MFTPLIVNYTMPRYGAKTYGRGVRKDSNDHFNDLWNKSRDSNRPATRLSPSKKSQNNRQQSIRQTRSSPAEQVKMSTSESSRPTRKNTYLGETVVGVTSPKRRRQTSSMDDPFSFSSDEDKSPMKKDKNTDNIASNITGTRQMRGSLQVENDAMNRNVSKVAQKGATTTRCTRKEKSNASQTLITQFANNATRNKDNVSSANNREVSDIDMSSVDGSLGSPNGSETSQQSAVNLVGSKRSSSSLVSAPLTRRGGKPDAILEQDSASVGSSEDWSSQTSSGSSAIQRGKSITTSQSCGRSLRTNTPGDNHDPVTKSEDSDDDPEVIIISSTSDSQRSTQSSSTLSSSQSSTSKPILKTSKSLPASKPSTATYDEFDFSDDGKA